MTIFVRNGRGPAGFSLIEVLIAVVILSVGLLSLAALQVQVTRGSSDSKAQSTALSLAQQELENLRVFFDREDYASIGSDPPAAETIDDLEGSGTSFERLTTVRRFVFDAAANDGAGEFVEVEDVGGEVEGREFKLIQTRVSWTDATGQERDVVLSDIVSAATPADSALTLRTRPNAPRRPQVRIFEPSDAGIIPIAIGSDQAAASSNPKPELSRRGSVTTTQFNIQTYQQFGSENPLLQRRVDMAFINCECMAGGLSSSDTPVFEATYWNGVRYVPPRRVTEPTTNNPNMVRKNFGVSVTNLQNTERFEANLCNTCCRDHQDYGGQPEDEEACNVDDDPLCSTDYVKVAAFRPSTEFNDDATHKHYKLVRETVNGELVDRLVEAGDSDRYLEVCRLVRVDGIFRVATDARMENKLLMRQRPDGSLITQDQFHYPPSVDEPRGIPVYSDFVVDYVTEAYGTGVPSDYPLTGLPVPTDVITRFGSYSDEGTTRNLTDPGGTAVVRAGIAVPYRLNARGLYVDFISREAREVAGCIGDESPRCRNFRNSSLLEVIPFFAVNLSMLSEWGTERPDPEVENDIAILSVTNQGIDNRGYDRGNAFAVQHDENPNDVVFAVAYGSNAGLVNRPAAHPSEEGRTLESIEQFEVLDGPAPRSFTVEIAPIEGDANFDNSQLNLAIADFAPGDPDSFLLRLCSRGVGAPRPGKNKPPGLPNHFCYFPGNATSIVLELGNYNSCLSGFAFDPDLGLCTRTGIDGALETSNVLDYKFCGFNRQRGDNLQQVGLTLLTPTDAGAPEEASLLRIADGSRLIVEELHGKTLHAVFVAQNVSCPTAQMIP
ncbi:MAG TPA: prepilin-type N-terminal cleavage/methylation domain-containing protein [Xanthomonadaceae bacterium]|nr:prepilin-type N-terminal cleavage/methylation domain-containing protein [Xanthomonadaceae bacterium]